MFGHDISFVMMFLYMIVVLMVGGMVGGDDENLFISLLRNFEEIYEMYNYVFTDQSWHFREGLIKEERKWEVKLNKIEGFDVALDFLMDAMKLFNSVNMTQTRVVPYVMFSSASLHISIKQPSIVTFRRVTKVPVSIIHWIVKDEKNVYTNTTVRYMFPRAEHHMSIFVNKSIEVKAISSGEAHYFSVDKVEHTEEVEDLWVRLAWIDYTVEMLKGTLYKAHDDWLDMVESIETLMNESKPLSELVLLRGDAMSVNVKYRQVEEEDEEEDELILNVPPGIMMSVRCDFIPFVRYSDGENVLYSVSWNGSHPWFDFMSDNVLKVRGSNNYPILRTVVDKESQLSFNVTISTNNACHYKMIENDSMSQGTTTVVVVLVVLLLLSVGGGAIVWYMRDKIRLRWHAVNTSNEL